MTGPGQSREQRVTPWAGRKSLAHSAQPDSAWSRAGVALRVPGQESAFSQVRLRKSNYTHFLGEEKRMDSILCLWPGPAHDSVVVGQGSNGYRAKCLGATKVPRCQPPANHRNITPLPPPFRGSPGNCTQDHTGEWTSHETPSSSQHLLGDLGAGGCH